MHDHQSTSNMDENFPEITLSTSVANLEVLYESIMKFANLKFNGFDHNRDVASQGWESFFNRNISFFGEGLLYS